MAILNNNPLVGASGNQGGYNINNSLRFRRSATAYLNRTPASAGNRKTFTYSAWIKRGLSGNNNFFNVNPNTGYSGFSLNFDLNVSGDIGVYQNTSGTNTLVVSTNALFRDFSAWYHVVVAIDTTQATAANRVLIYVNGVSQSLTISTQVALNTDLYVNSTIPHFIGREQTASGGAVNYFDGYMAEVNFIDGSQKAASDFGETDTTTGVWKPKAYSGTYGTNGFYLKFSDIATTSGSNAGLGKDFSGNSNYWTTNNISVTSGTTYDAMTDSPTLTSATVANYCVMNPLEVSNATLSRANLTLTSGSGWGSSKATFSIPTTGKWYWETTLESNLGTQLGIFVTSSTIAADPAGSASGYIYNGGNGQKFNNGTGTAYGASFTTNDVIGIAFDADAGTLTFYKNNSSQGTAFTGLTSQYSPIVATSSGGVASANFGQRPFSYTPPTGFVALNTFNLPTPTILQGNKYMDATLYTGNGTGQTITNAGSFRPDFLWIKVRSNTYDNTLADSVRGVSAFLASNTTAAEGTNSELTSFNSNGFTLGATGSMARNVSGQTYVAWQWQAGQGSTSSNTSGSITSTVSVNTTAGFSIVTWTGNGTNGTIGHGLGVAPKMIIAKIRSTTDNWLCYHSALGATKYINLNTQGTATTNAGAWNNTEPTSSVFSVSSTPVWLNNNGSTYVAYCWAEIAGFSKFGSYTGVSGADGAFVYTGFRPKFVMIKSSNLAGENWAIFDTSRNTYNVTYLELFPNASNAEVDGAARGAVLDLLSNGFKIRATNPELNDSAGSYIYMAFAENPTKYALAR